MSEIRVNFGSLSGGQAGIMATHGKLQATLDDLESQMQSMLGTWDGQAREAYYQCKQQWDTAAAAMAQTLQQIGTLVGNAHDNYHAAEQANTNTLVLTSGSTSGRALPQRLAAVTPGGPRKEDR